LRIIFTSSVLHTYGSARPFWRRPAGRVQNLTGTNALFVGRKQPTQASNGFPNKRKAYSVYSYGATFIDTTDPPTQKIISQGRLASRVTAKRAAETVEVMGAVGTRRAPPLGSFDVMSTLVERLDPGLVGSHFHSEHGYRLWGESSAIRTKGGRHPDRSPQVLVLYRKQVGFGPAMPSLRWLGRITRDLIDAAQSMRQEPASKKKPNQSGTCNRLPNFTSQVKRKVTTNEPINRPTRQILNFQIRRSRLYKYPVFPILSTTYITRLP